MERTSAGLASDRLTPEARERLERIALEILVLASECVRTTRRELMQLADRISTILDE